jgi:hypothetical protein
MDRPRSEKKLTSSDSKIFSEIMKNFKTKSDSYSGLGLSIYVKKLN